MRSKETYGASAYMLVGSLKLHSPQPLMYVSLFPQDTQY